MSDINERLNTFFLEQAKELVKHFNIKDIPANLDTVEINSQSIDYTKRKEMWSQMVYKENRLNNTLDDIAAACAKANIKKVVIDDAKILYRQISEFKHTDGVNAGKKIIFRGSTLQSIIAACVFKASIKNAIPKTVIEIANIFQITRDRVIFGIKKLDKLIKNSDNKILLRYQSSDKNIVVDYIKDRCPQLEISESDIELAIRISDNYCKLTSVPFHMPETVAAGSVLMTAKHRNLNIDAKLVEQTFALANNVTIKKIYSEMVSCTKDLISEITIIDV